MTIASAIAATSPNLWYKLDETAGTTAANSGSLSNNGTYSGSITLAQPGPEIGTFATRFFAGGQCVSGAMDINSFADVSIGMWISMDASGTNGTTYPILGIGDVSNRLTRGPLIYEAHSAIHVPAFWGGYNPGAFATGPTPQPVMFWHWIVFTWTQTNPGIKLYVDGTLVQSLNIGSRTAPNLLDPLLIRCDEPMLVAHACVWNGLLGQTEIQSIAGQLSAWPYSVPINTPYPSGGGGGGLTPDQATQLSETHGWTSDIPGLVSASNFISSTVNTIQGIVTDIQTKVNQLTTNLTAGINSVINAVSATITTLTGDVTKSIGQLLSGLDPNNLTLDTLGSACHGSTIDANLSDNFYYGLTLECTSYADWYVFTGPADDYTTQSLGTLDIWRGGHLVLRKGLHTLTDEVYPLPALPPVWIVVQIAFTPGDYIVKLTPAPETCWTMKALRFTP